MTKFIFITGSVISGIGKGTCSSSIGMILKAYGLKVTAIKIDPYLNVDSGSMSPWQHGECYVLEDGTESDLDLGNYERFLDVKLSNCHSITSGKIYRDVIEKERRGDYLGATVQMVPHLTDYIQELITNGAKVNVNVDVNKNNTVDNVDGDNDNDNGDDDNDTDNEPDVCLVELGGSIGDMEGLVFCEAIAQLTRNTLKDEDSCFVHLSFVPTIHGNEVKTKPTQHSIRTVRGLGIFPDFLILRTESELKSEEVDKVSRMCQIRKENIIINPNTNRVYDVPQVLIDQEFHYKIARKLHLENRVSSTIQPNLQKYREIISHFRNENIQNVTIGIVGKYTGSQDTYLSLMRSLEMASVNAGKKLHIKWINSETNVNDMDIEIDSCDSIIIPGGFGDRGIEGMIHATKKCREESKQLLGICLGFQIMCIEYARHVLGFVDANSTEFDKKTKTSVIIPVASESVLGGTMRLGKMDITLTNNPVYNAPIISRRFRHRYGLNHAYVHKFMSDDFKIFGTTADGMISNISIGDNMIGVQYHPEFGANPDEVFGWLFQ